MGYTKNIIIFASVLTFGSCLTSCTNLQTSTSEGRISGAGATFPSKLYTRWFSDIYKQKGPRVNYQAIGSGSGRKAFIDETVNFGASDDPMSVQDIAKVRRGVIQIPVVGGTIAFAYNHNCELKLTQQNAVRVALGQVENWNELGCPPPKLI